MKIMCAIAFVIIFSFMASAQGKLEYNGKPINTAQIKRLYDTASDFLFAHNGKVYDLRDKEGEVKVLTENVGIGEMGIIKGRITTRIDKATTLIEIVFTRKYYEDEPLDYPGNKIEKTTCTATLLDAPESGDNISLPVIRIETPKGNSFSENMTFAVLKQLTKQEFAKYIKTHNLYTYKVNYIPCPDCKGKGYIEREPERGKMAGAKGKCPRCNGKKKIKYSVDKVPVEL